jgi:hypothetical protein
MSSLQDSLRRFLAVDGVRTAALIDVATGMIVRAAGQADPELPVTAACVAEEARAVRSAVGAASDPDRGADVLLEIATITGSRLQVSKILLDQPGEGMVLFVDVDRARSNIGLASLQVSELAPAVLG